MAFPPIVRPTGGKLWRLKYRVNGREKKLAIGTYPEVSLGDARRRRKKINATVRAENTVAAIAKEYCEKRKRDGNKAWAARSATRSEHLLSLLIAPLGQMPIADIHPADVIAAVRKIERKGKLERARRALQLADGLFRHGVAAARITSDPTRDLRGAHTAPTVAHSGAVLEPARVGELLRAIDDYNGQPIPKLAMQLAPHVFVRPGELRHADWSDIELEGAP